MFKSPTFKYLGYAAFIAPLIMVAACDQNKGPAEKAGQAIDNAGQKVQDAINPPGPAEKAGRALDNATGN